MGHLSIKRVVKDSNLLGNSIQLPHFSELGFDDLCLWSSLFGYSSCFQCMQLSGSDSKKHRSLLSGFHISQDDNNFLAKECLNEFTQQGAGKGQCEVSIDMTSQTLREIDLFCFILQQGICVLVVGFDGSKLWSKTAKPCFLAKNEILPRRTRSGVKNLGQMFSTDS